MKKIMIYAGLLVGAASLAALPLHAAPPAGKGKPSSEATNNLSVPAILVGPLGAVVCGPSDSAPSALVPPTGTPATGYEVPGSYWVQKVHKWQPQKFQMSLQSPPTLLRFGTRLDPSGWNYVKGG